MTKRVSRTLRASLPPAEVSATSRWDEDEDAGRDVRTLLVAIDTSQREVADD
ncbi:MAG TPA: hypothetical protein VGD91_10490 [Trebonia sp.]